MAGGSLYLEAHTLIRPFITRGPLVCRCDGDVNDRREFVPETPQMQHVRYYDNSAPRERYFDTDALMDSALPALSDLAFELEEAVAETGVVGKGGKNDMHSGIGPSCKDSGKAQGPAAPLLEVKRPHYFPASPTSPTSATDMEAFFFDEDAEANKLLMDEARAMHCLVGTSIHAQAGATPPHCSFG